ncbi:MAG: hypothetical protein ABIG55_06040 [Candidatus Omnitrophota bacterium]
MKQAFCVLSILIFLTGCSSTGPVGQTMGAIGEIAKFGGTVVKTTGDVAITAVKTGSQALSTAAATPGLRESAIKSFPLQ